MGSGEVAIAALPTVICLKVLFSDGLGGGTQGRSEKYSFKRSWSCGADKKGHLRNSLTT